MNRSLILIIATVLLFGVWSCGEKSSSTQNKGVKHTHTQAVDTTKKKMVKPVISTSVPVDLKKPFYVHYKGFYLGHKAELDLTNLRNSIFFTLCYYPTYNIVSDVVNRNNQGFTYAYVNRFGDTLEQWDVKLSDAKHLKLHVQTSIADTTYIFTQDYSSAIPLNVYAYDTSVSMASDTSKEILLIRLTSFYSKLLNFSFLQNLPEVKLQAKRETQEMLRKIKSYSKNELETMFFPFNKDRLMDVEYNNNGLLVISSNEYTFMGGAHGNNTLKFYNIDTKHNKLITLSDIMDTKGLAALIWEKLPDKDQLFVDKQSVYVPKNFFVKGRRIYFVYNVYEIAPYVVGSISVNFDFSEIKDRLHKDFLSEFYPGLKL